MKSSRDGQSTAQQVSRRRSLRRHCLFLGEFPTLLTANESVEMLDFSFLRDHNASLYQVHLGHLNIYYASLFLTENMPGDFEKYYPERIRICEFVYAHDVKIRKHLCNRQIIRHHAANDPTSSQASSSCAGHRGHGNRSRRFISTRSGQPMT